MLKNKKLFNNGFIAITAIILLSAFFIVLFVGMFFSAAEEMERTVDKEKIMIALSLANSCAEEALNRLKNDINYDGEESINIGKYQCDILELESTEYMKTIKTEGEADGYLKRIQIEVSIQNYPELEIIDWQEVSDFTD